MNLRFFVTCGSFESKCRYLSDEVNAMERDIKVNSLWLLVKERKANKRTRGGSMLKWHLRTWLSGEHGDGATLTIELGCLKGLFQP